METMSLPMKHDVAVAGEVEPAQRAGGRPPRVAREGALAAVVRRWPSRRSISAATPAAAASSRAAELVRRRRRAGPGGCARAGRRPASPPTATRPCGASRRGRARAPRQALARPGQEALGIALDDVLQRAAVDLHRVGHVAAEPAGEDRRAHDEVVGERHVGPRARADVAHRGDVGLHVGLDLGVAALQQRARLEALVAVGDVDGQQARRCPGATPSRGPARAASSTRSRAVLPRARPRRRSRAPRAAAPGTAGRRCARPAPAPRTGARCRRWSPSRAGDSRGRRGPASAGRP